MAKAKPTADKPKTAKPRKTKTDNTKEDNSTREDSSKDSPDASSPLPDPKTKETQTIDPIAPYSPETKTTKPTIKGVEILFVPGESSKQERSAPPPDADGHGTERGNVDSTGAEPDLLADSVEAKIETPRARLTGETRAMTWERLRKAARSAGLARGQGPGTAYEWANRETAKLFAPPVPVVVAELVDDDENPTFSGVAEPKVSPIGDKTEIPAAETSPPAAKPSKDDGQDVSGLSDLPPSWPELPANAQLQVEIAWVTANRLRVRDGTGVNLSKALSPAPSYSALSWLETSILFPSKFADISVKATASQDDEKEEIRREKIALEEIRSILKEMLDAKDV